jgi:hypothetical protein
MRKKLVKRYRIAIALAILAGVCLAFARTVSALYLPGFVLLTVVVVLNLSIRCPDCGKYLTGKNKWGIPHYCPNCGKAISDAETEE